MGVRIIHALLLGVCIRALILGNFRVEIAESANFGHRGQTARSKSIPCQQPGRENSVKPSSCVENELLWHYLAFLSREPRYLYSRLSHGCRQYFWDLLWPLIGSMLLYLPYSDMLKSSQNLEDTGITEQTCARMHVDIHHVPASLSFRRLDPRS